MKRLKVNQILGFIIIFFIFVSLSSCATTRASKLADKRGGLMLMDKSEYPMNKKWNGNKRRR